MSLKSQIPNILTLSNLVLGGISIFFSATNRPEMAAWLILVAAALDLADGLVARALGVSGELGKQLDSLADVISFGLGPAFIALQFNGVFTEDVRLTWKATALFLPLIMAAFSAYRLASFNIDERQSTEFRGLPTPANALFWVGMALAGTGGVLSSEAINTWVDYFRQSTGLVGFASVLLGLLLIAETPLLALKFDRFGFRGNENKILLIGASVLLFVFFGFSSIPIILLLYFILSLTARKSHGIHS
jgi:CDP-diacylglycerol--serine O-phosphatidyltransferase